MTSVSTDMRHVIRDERATVLVGEALKYEYHRHENSCACRASGDSEPAFGGSTGPGFFGQQGPSQLLTDASSFSGTRATRDKIIVLLPQKVCCLCFLDDSESKEAKTARKVSVSSAQEFFVLREAIRYVYRAPGRSQSADYPRCRKGMSSVDKQTATHEKEQPKTLQTRTAPEAASLEAQRKLTQELSKVPPRNHEPVNFESRHTDANTGTKQNLFFFESAFLKKLQAPTAKVVSELISAETSTPLSVPVEDKAAIRIVQVAAYMWIHVTCSDLSSTLPRLPQVSWDLQGLSDCNSIACQTEPVEFVHPKTNRKKPTLEVRQTSPLPSLPPEQPLFCDPSQSQFNSPGFHCTCKLSARQSHEVPSECKQSNDLLRQSIQRQNQSFRQLKRIQDTQRSLGAGCQVRSAARKSTDKQSKVSQSLQNLIYSESQDDTVKIRKATMTEEVVSSQTAETWEPVIYSRINAVNCIDGSDSASVGANRKTYRSVHHGSPLPDTYFGQSPRYNSSLPTCSSEASSCSCGDFCQQKMFPTEPGVNRQHRPPHHSWRKQRQQRNGCDSQGVGTFKNINNSVMFQGPQRSSGTSSPASFVPMDPMQSVTEVINGANSDFACLFLTLDRAQQQLIGSARAVRGRNPSISRKSDATQKPRSVRGRFSSRSFDTHKVSSPECSKADDGNDQRQGFLVSVDSEDSEVGNCSTYDISIGSQQCGEGCFCYSNDQYRATNYSRYVTPATPSMEQPVGDSLASRSFSQDWQQRRYRRNETELLDSVADNLLGLSRKLQTCLRRVHSAAAEIKERNAELS